MSQSESGKPTMDKKPVTNTFDVSGYIYLEVPFTVEVEAESKAKAEEVFTEYYDLESLAEEHLIDGTVTDYTIDDIEELLG